jgi:hypothetical protein
MKAMEKKVTSLRSIEDVVDVATDERYKAEIKQVSDAKNDYVTHLQAVQQAIPTWVAVIQNAHELPSEAKSDWWAKLTGLTSYVNPDNYQLLIDALQGGHDPVRGDHGGLKEAIAFEMARSSKSTEQAQQSLPHIQQAIQQKVMQEQTPAPVPAPEVPAPAPTPEK